MELYIGGCAQGKLNYVLKQTGISEERVVDAATYSDGDVEDGARIFNHFHRWVRSQVKAGKDPEDMIARVLSRNPHLIIISDEVGSGIVPMEAEEREYREKLGRILCKLAEKAVKVERILCGIGQKLK
ncbi:bifunctional adenosylcobinamide kinase/adenosylcobinamide-phosphate guanylyltransferase [Gorillibacterium massiliense]|uniref:bifunctional adenosylcobinamide kinase/adenosylcobinamide-phosphate guanylyltransferase n=1 Tax=Gorillibacterium massiliense TaxID=1280390 RepID=UPI00059358E7|nr:bifunctional adenosylcobinamide kinase/adenosylcobinamide-phosphate guanylyltransferase [Gorillibacterium massiliense]